ncbi:MAG TPA: MFS transporter [Magnetospirillaceae bacterium]|jgi:acyl-[acyl-carrier-protein]-phospholipid O-acyltransferase/long-chain-fatty-acid--[acyl-carrier-protein] ligase
MSDATPERATQPGATNPADSPAPLLVARRFLPLFVTQFLGATNDTLFKNAIGILIIYRLLAGNPGEAQLLVSAAAGIFILPYLLLSSAAGELADRMEKSRLMRLIKLTEVCIMILGAASLFVGNPYLLLVVLFLLGIHSTFFGPLKYSILPQYLRPNELIVGNALIEGGTFIAILIGTIIGALIVLGEGGLTVTSVVVIGIACAGLISSFFLPRAAANQPDLRVDWNLWRGAIGAMRVVRSSREVNWAVVGVSWFWAVGAVYLGQLPAFAKTVLGADEQVVTLMLTMFSIGIGAGSLACQKILRGQVSPRFSPLALLGMALFTFDLYIAATNAARPDITGSAGAALIGINAFISSMAGLHVLLDLVVIAAFGGIFTVPLYAIMQLKSDSRERARAVAGNNILNSIYIVALTVVVLVLLKLGVTVPGIFIACGVGNLLVGLLAFRLLPDAPLGHMVVWAVGRAKE